MRRQGYLIIATDPSVKFHAPALPGDTLETIRRIQALGGLRSVRVQEMRGLESQRLMVTAEVTRVFVIEAGRAVRISHAFHEKLTAVYVGDIPPLEQARKQRLR